MNPWLILLFGGLATYGIRLSFILLWGRVDMPSTLTRALRYVPAAVLSAIIFPELLVRDSQLDLSLANPRLYAGLLAVLVAYRTRSALWTILSGLAALYLLQYLFS